MHDSTPAVSRHYSVLVVDDEPSVRLLFSEWIKAGGHTAAVAADADTALRALRDGAVDVAVCDIRMPGHDGVWLIDQLRREFPHVGIIIATGLATMPAKTTLQPGVVAYLVKPFSRDALLHAIERGAQSGGAWKRTLDSGRGNRPLPEL